MAKAHGLCFTYGIWTVIMVVVTIMTVATANLKQTQEEGSEEQDGVRTRMRRSCE